ncbi:MAG: MerR family DNA-binding protein [Proteobacteria bacterium]|nr:MerR family DNA-binding protein [Pseudomonadota bacterium]
MVLKMPGPTGALRKPRRRTKLGSNRGAARTLNGYRVYGDADVQTLRFIRRARSLGFTVEDVSNLLALWSDRRRTSPEIKALAARRISDIERKMRELESLKRALLDLAERCRGDDRPDCPIIDELAGADANDPVATRKWLRLGLRAARI